MPDERQAFLDAAGASACDLGHDLDLASAPFEETAALISQLDLVVTCDTSIGHLAGALGMPVWLALPHVPDWRWMLGLDDTPWYPSTRLVRQRIAGDWEGVFQEMAVQLRQLADCASTQ